MTFDKLLIANRGEIACRVMATARRMGLRTVAVCSDADAGARHVAMADEAVRIGPAPVTESYLQGARIIEAAQATGAQAIHPGYGFLSENPGFVRQVEAAGLIFVGPPAAAIEAMGLKDAAKARMQEAGVPVVPGYHGDSQDPDLLAAEAEKIGYPVLIKARAGGGGKGMRLVGQASDFSMALQAAQREAQASFGDPHCLIEKYVTQPRHVEIQVMADANGNVVHLFERDCSLQRRHQKVIEEAPAPGMPDDVRAAMGQAAVEAAKAIGYQGAGTVEFIADGSQGLRADGFWFMEMNTRLQVEHPVTEAITGLDLVELQLKVAAGAPLPFAQDDLKIQGHAFEARLYAEDPSRDFLPAIGTLDHLRPPEAVSFTHAPCRIDSGVREGDMISPHYDPMIAKLIAHGPDRRAALAALTRALEATEIAGLTTNLSFLRALTLHAGFAAGEVDTGLIGRDQEALTAPEAPSAHAMALAALADLGLTKPGSGGPWEVLTGWRAWGSAQHTARLGETEIMVEITAGGLLVDHQPVTLQRDGARYSVTLGGHTRSLGLHLSQRSVTVFDAGATHSFTRPDPLSRGDAGAALGDAILSPMPGQVTQVLCAPGDGLTQGQPVLVLEAMKMEHTLTAPRDGVLAELRVASGDQVSDGAVLAQLEALDD